MNITDLLTVGTMPPKDATTWLKEAESGVDYVQKNAVSDEIILYAYLPNAWICSGLAPLKRLKKVDIEQVYGVHLDADSTCCIDYNSGSSVYIAEPFDGCDIMDGGEQLVFRRKFDGVDTVSRTEISQKLLHALGLYWMQDKSAYCKLDDRGDVKPVLKVISLQKQTGDEEHLVITILRDELEQYMVATGTAQVTKFDFDRFLPNGSFNGWSGQGDIKSPHDKLIYHTHWQLEASYAYGVLVVLPTLTKAKLRKRLQQQWSDDDKEFESFIAFNRKTGKVGEYSCNPKYLASYFAPESELPYEVTPAFFNAEVLSRYKKDPEKYHFEERHISSRAGWHLKSYDVNEAGQVHTYLIYLANLPTHEQQYWKSFNEEPKGGISKRAVETDLKGIFSTEANPLADLKSKVRKLDSAPPTWWKPRGEQLLGALHYPVTPSIEEWADAILALDQLVVEGFAVKPIRELLANAGGVAEDDWQSLRLLQELLAKKGMSEADAKELMEPLKLLHSMRSKVKGHATSDRKKLVDSARVDHGSLATHFRALITNCYSSFLQLEEKHLK